MSCDCLARLEMALHEGYGGNDRFAILAAVQAARARHSSAPERESDKLPICLDPINARNIAHIQIRELDRLRVWEKWAKDCAVPALKILGNHYIHDRDNEFIGGFYATEAKEKAINALVSIPKE